MYLTVPKNGEVLNLETLVSMKDFLTENKLEITLTNGETRAYTGEGAKILKSEIMFWLTYSQEMKKQMLSPIVAATQMPPILI